MASFTAKKSTHGPCLWMVQNYLIVWLDENINENNEDCQRSLTKLREVLSTVRTFNSVDKCTSFIRESPTKKILFICSGKNGQAAVRNVHKLRQINAIYIFCQDKNRHEVWTRSWSKIKGVFTNITPICEALRRDTETLDENTTSMSFVSIRDDALENDLTSIDQSFMYTQILKEILLSIEFQKHDFKAFIDYCREHFKDNWTELQDVNKLEKEYRRHKPTWWYTRESFLYSMLNDALRTMNIDLIIRLGFFIRDLHEQIAELHLKQYPIDPRSKDFVVYRGDIWPQNVFDQLKKNKDNLLSFNKFLSTTKEPQKAVEFASKNPEKSDVVRVFFVITIDPSIRSTPFADIADHSSHPEEKEVLFSMHSIFRIIEIEKLKDESLWQVDLELTGEENPQLRTLTDNIRKETFPKAKGWYRLGELLIKLGEFDAAKQVYDTLLNQTDDERKQGEIYYQIGRVKDGQRENEEAIIYYKKALAIDEKYYPSNHRNLAACYSNIGRVYDKVDKYFEALSFHQQALEIYKKSLGETDLDLAIAYGNIGRVYFHMNSYTQALSFHEKSIEIAKKSLSSCHPQLAWCYNNIGMVYQKKGDHSKALSFYERALKIAKQALPSTHHHLKLYENNVRSIKI